QAGRLAQQPERLAVAALELRGERLDEERLDRQRLHRPCPLRERDRASGVRAEHFLRLPGPAGAEPERGERGQGRRRATRGPAAARPAENDLRACWSGFTARARATRKTGALTAAKSQSMSTSPCNRYAGSAKATASSGSVGRRAPRGSTSIATRKRTRPTAPVS